MKNIENIDISATARLFSAKVLQELSRYGGSPLLARLLRESGLAEQLLPTETLEKCFQIAFRALRRKAHRHEYIYKSAITNKVLLGTHSLQTASMITEFRVGDCKADVVILNGTGTVYEIKSERDTLTRLERQIGAYMNVFATVNVIVGENHTDHVLDMTPPEIGVMELSSKHRISTIRTGENKPERTRADTIFESINLHEAQIILRNLLIDVPEVPNTRLYDACRELFIQIPGSVAHTQMVSTLKHTRKLTALSELVNELPSCLYSAALTSKIRRQDHSRLISTMGLSISDALEWA
ncbi:sce7726 family protein [Woodsholea maritima]|uniref:sce7726 family protein n=1 Tax=Woodsholea maritima TaxID=240237 RepID=UPI00035D634C|nr:sce7726 family protein [Woodsholea maritima]